MVQEEEDAPPVQQPDGEADGGDAALAQVSLHCKLAPSRNARCAAWLDAQTSPTVVCPTSRALMALQVRPNKSAKPSNRWRKGLLACGIAGCISVAAVVLQRRRAG